MDVAQLVINRLRPVLDADPDFAADLPLEIQAQCALLGWDSSLLTEPETVYVAALVLQAFAIPRLITACMNLAVSVDAGPAKTQWEQRTEMLKRLAKTIDKQVKAAAEKAAPEEMEDERPAPPPLVGIVRVGDPE